MSSSDPRIHAGVGKAARIDRVIVRWPDGPRETFGPFPANRYVVLKRGKGSPYAPDIDAEPPAHSENILGMRRRFVLPEIQLTKPLNGSRWGALLLALFSAMAHRLGHLIGLLLLLLLHRRRAWRRCSRLR